MSDREDLMKKLMDFKFLNGQLKDLNFGDIYLLAMSQIYNNISEAIQKSTEVLNITGKVIPVTLDEITICAELTDGTTIQRKDKIPEIVSDKVEVINRIYISPSNCRRVHASALHLGHKRIFGSRQVLAPTLRVVILYFVDKFGRML